jgi:hypothetical protein
VEGVFHCHKGSYRVINCSGLCQFFTPYQKVSLLVIISRNFFFVISALPERQPDSICEMYSKFYFITLCRNKLSVAVQDDANDRDISLWYYSPKRKDSFCLKTICR